MKQHRQQHVGEWRIPASAALLLILLGFTLEITGAKSPLSGEWFNPQTGKGAASGFFENGTVSLSKSPQTMSAERCKDAGFANERLASFFGNLVENVGPITVLAHRSGREDDIAFRQAIVGNKRGPKSGGDC